MELEQLKQIYKVYEQELLVVLQNAKPLAGWFGVGADDPRNDRCHHMFFDGVAKWVSGFAAEKPDSKAAEAAVYLILEAAAANRNKQTYWYYLAAQGHAKQLLPFMEKGQCAELLQWYDKTYPRRERLPVNDELYSLIKKSSK